MTSAWIGLAMVGTTTAITRERAEARPAAWRLGMYPNAEATPSTWSRVFCATRPGLEMQRDAVITETPAARATSCSRTTGVGEAGADDASTGAAPRSSDLETAVIDES